MTTQPDKGAGTSDVLAMMTNTIMGRKTQAAAKLTPVGSEITVVHTVSTSPIPDKVAAPFPNDKPREVVLEAIAGLERERDKLNEVIAALRLLADAPEQAAATPADEQKQTEREADQRAEASGLIVIDGGGNPDADDEDDEDEMSDAVAEATVTKPGGDAAPIDTDKLQQDAQAAVFGAGGSLAFTPTIEQPIPTGWVCPTHGAAKTAVKTSRLGREYRACSECGSFEKL